MLAHRCREWSTGRCYRELAERIVAPLRKEVVLPRYQEALEGLV